MRRNEDEGIWESKLGESHEGMVMGMYGIPPVLFPSFEVMSGFVHSSWEHLLMVGGIVSLWF